MGVQGEFFERAAPTLEITDEQNGPIAAGPVQATSHATKRMMKDLSIPKLYYSISEVSRLTGLEAYVLRYWETEFDELRPQKNRAGNRIYSNRDIKFILRIKELLREQRYTIDGAKHIIRGERITDSKMDGPVAETPAADPAQIPIPDAPKTPQTPLTLEEIRSMKSALEGLRAMLR